MEQISGSHRADALGCSALRNRIELGGERNGFFSYYFVS